MKTATTASSASRPALGSSLVRRLRVLKADRTGRLAAIVGALGLLAFAGTATAAGPPFVEQSGTVVIEAENANGTVARDGTAWQVEGALENSVGGHLAVLPNRNRFIEDGYVASAARADYEIVFTHPGTYYVWGRGWSEDYEENSVHIGLNGQVQDQADKLYWVYLDQWQWTGDTKDDDARATITVPSAGTHTLNMYMREDGARIDRLLLTTDGNYSPVADGPAESPRDPAVGGGGDPVVAAPGTPSITYPDAVMEVGRFQRLVPTIRGTSAANFDLKPFTPQGITFDWKTGQIFGTPERPGTSTHTLTLNNAAGTTVITKTITVRVAAAGQGTPLPPGSETAPPPPPAGPGTEAPGQYGEVPAGARCRAVDPPPQSSSNDDEIALTPGQLAINQRIGQAAIRRLAAVERWLAAGVTGADICGGSLAAADFAGIEFSSAEPTGIAPPTPRRLRVLKATGNRTTRFSVTPGQLLINQRIYQTGLRRARALAARLDGGLTGGDVVDGTIATDRLRPGLDVAAPGAAPRVGPSRGPRVKVKRSTARLRATAAQLKTNQRIAQAAVRDANRLMTTIERGLTGGNFRDGTLTAADLRLP